MFHFRLPPSQRIVSLLSTVTFALQLAACGADDTSSTTAAVDAGTDRDTASGADAADVEPAPAVPEFGSPETRTIAGFASGGDGLDVPRDLEFDPEFPNNLWVASRGNDGIVILFDAGTEQQRTELFLDAFRNHFMEEVSSLAFGAPGTFATCQESRNTYDGQARPDDFMGPALWPSDLDVFAAIFQNPLGRDLGSHIDMLHESPLCMGIAHYRHNEYFVFDGYAGELVYYDFAEDHGPGQDDHSDGIIHRYRDVRLTRVEGVPGHMEYHPESNRVFIADTGAARVIAFEVGSATRGRSLVSLNEPIADYAEYEGGNVEVFAFEGLVEPSGLAIHDGRLFVGDHATGEIIAYDLETGAELGRVDTEAEALMGITVGPDGRLWMVDAAYNEVLRLDP